jgi:hypothetical protein
LFYTALCLFLLPKYGIDVAQVEERTTLSMPLPKGTSIV